MMIRTCLLLAVLTMLAVPACGAPVGQVGGAGEQGHLNLADVRNTVLGQGVHAGWGVSEQVRADMAMQNTLGATVGVPESIRERLLNRETVAAGVGVPQEVKESFLTQNALGSAAAVPQAVQAYLTNRATTAAAVGIPAEIREHLMVALNAQ